MRAIGKYGTVIHDASKRNELTFNYCGIEKIFERIAVSIDNDLPGGENWHIDLLHQMEEPVEGAREKVISEELMKKLKEFLRFRHLFRHIYGFRLTWEKINPLCNDMENVLNKFKEEINCIFKNGISVIK